jgi:hypothetical protein
MVILGLSFLAKILQCPFGQKTPSFARLSPSKVSNRLQLVSLLDERDSSIYTFLLVPEQTLRPDVKSFGVERNVP